MTWHWPFPNLEPNIPTDMHPGSFGAKRKHDIHTGVDLYCSDGQIVCAVEDGIVTATGWFTGQYAESPWWNDTRFVIVEGNTGAVCYGEIIEIVSVSEVINAGDPIGHVSHVLKKDKGLPTAMLHLELYKSGVKLPVWWRLEEPQPEILENPTMLLNEARNWNII